jgi:hypothetical protein
VLAARSPLCASPAAMGLVPAERLAVSADSFLHSELVVAIESGIRSTGDTTVGDARRYEARSALRSLAGRIEAYENALRSIGRLDERSDDDNLHGSAIARAALNSKAPTKENYCE